MSCLPPPAVAAATKVLWIGNLEAYPDAASLERIFSIFGTVDNVKGEGQREAIVVMSQACVVAVLWLGL